MTYMVGPLAPFLFGIALLRFPGWVANLLYSAIADREKALWTSAAVGVAVAVFLHLLFLWLSGFDPIDPEEIANGTADLFRLGGYPALGWYPVAAAMFGLALSLYATIRRTTL